ncbi:MAG: hypothetical protein IJW78_03605 [Clostridia bacterium]|nr:hypothetical protein [Clostridia bacterium]
MAGKSLFYKIYFSLIAVFLVLLAGGLGLLYAWLNAYEQARPEAVMQSIYSTYIQKGNLYGLKSLGGLEVSPYETEATLNAAFGAFIDGKKTEVQTTTASLKDQTRTYIVTADGKPLLTVELKKQKDGRFGIKRYAPSSITLASECYKTVTVTAPENAKVSVNGKVLTAEKAQKEGLSEALKKEQNSATLVLPQTYRLESLLNDAPEILVRIDGEEQAVVGEKGVYTVQQKLDEALAKQAQNFALEAAQNYAAYMQDDSSFAKIASYLEPDTDFYENVKTSMVTFAWDHDSYAFEQNDCGPVYAYGNDLYRCRVSFVQVLRLGATVYEDKIDQYVYLRKGAEGWKVIDMQQ